MNFHALASLKESYWLPCAKQETLTLRENFNPNSQRTLNGHGMLSSQASKYNYSIISCFCFYLFIRLPWVLAVAQGVFDLHCSNQDLLLVACKLLHAACKFPAEARAVQFPDWGQNLGPLHWEHRLVATAPPGKSPQLLVEIRIRKCFRARSDIKVTLFFLIKETEEQRSDLPKQMLVETRILTPRPALALFSLLPSFS